MPLYLPKYQQIIKQVSSVEDFINSQAKLSEIFNLKTFEDNEKQFFSFIIEY